MYRTSSKGMALLLVVMALAVISAVVIEIMYRARISATVVTNRRDSEKAYALALAAFRWSIFRIQLDGALDKIPEIPGTNYGGRKDDLSEAQWAIPLPYPLPLTALKAGTSEEVSEETSEELPKEAVQEAVDLGGSFLSVITDESAKINLNDVGSGGPPGNVGWSGAAEVLENLLLSPRFQRFFSNTDHRELLWATDDWTDSDSEVNHLGGGIEDAEYQTDIPDFHVKNAPFYTFREMRLLRIVSEELFVEVSPFVTVYPFNARLPRVNTQPPLANGRINVNTAPLEIIAAIISRQAISDPKERLQCAQQIVRFRANVVFRSVPKGKEPSFFGALEQFCGLAAEGAQVPPPVSPRVVPILHVRSDLFAIEATGIVNQTEKMVRAVVSRENPRNPQILYWKVI